MSYVILKAGDNISRERCVLSNNDKMCILICGAAIAIGGAIIYEDYRKRQNLNKQISSSNNIQQIPLSSNNIQQIPSNLNNIQQIPSNLNNIQQIPSNLNNIQQISSNLNNIQQIPSNLNETEQILNLNETQQESTPSLNETEHIVIPNLNETQQESTPSLNETEHIVIPNLNETQQGLLYEISSYEDGITPFVNVECLKEVYTKDEKAVKEFILSINKKTTEDNRIQEYVRIFKDFTHPSWSSFKELVNYYIMEDNCEKMYKAIDQISILRKNIYEDIFTKLLGHQQTLDKYKKPIDSQVEIIKGILSNTSINKFITLQELSKENFTLFIIILGYWCNNYTMSEISRFRGDSKAGKYFILKDVLKDVL